MLIRILSGCLVILGIFFVIALIRVNLHLRDAEPRGWSGQLLLALSQVATWFLATFGVSDTAVNLVIFKKAKLTEVRTLPSTIVMGAVIPLCFMSVSYLNRVEVDPVTILFLIGCQCVGGLFGATLVKRLPVGIIRIVMAFALGTTGAFLLFKLFFLHMEGGTSIGLTGWRLPFAGALMLFMEALVMLGFGNMSPNMSLLLLLGMSPTAIYPVVMAGNAFGAAVGCIKFLKDGTYNPRVALLEAAGGIFGVVAAVRLVSGMNVLVLQLLMIALMFYSAWDILRDGK